MMVLANGEPYGNCNGSIWFKCIASLAFKLDATIIVGHQQVPSIVFNISLKTGMT